MLWMDMWVHPYTDMPLKVGVDFWEIWGILTESEFCSKVMVGASNPRRLHPTSISYIYKVFQHPDMLWMDMWVHPYTDTSLKVGVDFWEIGGMAESK